ncbi:MAG TPA: Hsp20/alpha crystallin family protein [Acidiferrobacterales bacterium]|nr:Hsp20/alpha crystallin family protein [Acidiferrobacterales bacterium]
MNTLMQQTPSRNLLSDDFDNLFEGFFRPLRRFGEVTGQGLVPAIDVTERDNEYLIRAEMPGVPKDAIEVTLADGVLTISGESREEHEEKEGNRVIRQERRYGKYTRSLRLDTQIDEKKVKANYKDGILELVLPKADEVKPKKIAVG